MQIDEESAKSGITLTIDFRQLMRENEVLANSIQLQYHKVYPYMERAAQEYVKERIGVVGAVLRVEVLGQYIELHAEGLRVVYKSSHYSGTSSGAQQQYWHADQHFRHHHPHDGREAGAHLRVLRLRLLRSRDPLGGSAIPVHEAHDVLQPRVHEPLEVHAGPERERVHGLAAREAAGEHQRDSRGKHAAIDGPDSARVAGGEREAGRQGGGGGLADRDSRHCADVGEREKDEA